MSEANKVTDITKNQVKLKYYSNSHHKTRWYVGPPKAYDLQKTVGDEAFLEAMEKADPSNPVVIIGDTKLTVVDFKPTFSYDEADAVVLSKKEDVDKALYNLHMAGYKGFEEIPVTLQ